MYHLGLSFVGESTQDRSTISRYFSREVSLPCEGAWQDKWGCKELQTVQGDCQDSTYQVSSSQHSDNQSSPHDDLTRRDYRENHGNFNVGYHVRFSSTKHKHVDAQESRVLLHGSSYKAADRLVSNLDKAERFESLGILAFIPRDQQL
jgi:hypothetical protein